MDGGWISKITKIIYHRLLMTVYRVLSKSMKVKGKETTLQKKKKESKDFMTFHFVLPKLLEHFICKK